MPPVGDAASRADDEDLANFADDGDVTTSGSAPDPSASGGSGAAADHDDTRIVGAALLADGLCPWQFGSAPALTLRFTSAPFVCNADMRNALIDAGEIPNWYAELHLPFDEPGVYDLGEVGGESWIHLIDADTGGSGAGGGPILGTIEIVSVDATRVIGIASGLVPFGVDGVEYDINGSFDAVRCTAAEWLDVEFDPHDPQGGIDPACTLPPD